MSLAIRRGITGLLSVALLVVSLCPSVHSAFDEGDANRDGAVDVRDVQAVVAGLRGASGASAADVNQDGIVDVCDLQYVLARSMVEQTGSNEPSPSDSGNGTLPLTRPYRVFLDVGYLDPQVAAASTPFFARQESAVALAELIPPTGTTRLLFGVSPHAPPKFA
ncbi:MAG: dockerin type I domain-containing protein [Pseudomonadota bacterium]